MAGVPDPTAHGGSGLLPIGGLAQQVSCWQPLGELGGASAGPATRQLVPSSDLCTNFFEEKQKPH